MKENVKRTTVKLAQCAVFVVLMIVAAFIRIPVPFVPITFQTMMSVLAGLLLGPWYGAASVAVYLFLGLLGLPVFAGGGGIVYVVNLTFGYLLGFVAAAFAAGLVVGKKELTFRRAAAAAMAGLFVNYLIGIPYFACIWSFYLHNAGLWENLVLYNFIVIPKDAILCLLAAFLAVRVSPALFPVYKRKKPAQNTVSEGEKNGRETAQNGDASGR